MAGVGVTPAGQAVAVPAAATLVLPRGGILLGFFASATTTLNIFDSATVAAAGAGNQKLAATACAVGWNPFPLEVTAGLVMTPGAAITAIVI